MLHRTGTGDLAWIKWLSFAAIAPSMTREWPAHPGPLPPGVLFHRSDMLLR
jgi:hypothetical protein